MVTQGQLLRLEAAPGREQELEALLASSRFAVRFGRSEYGIFGFPGATMVGSELLAGAPRSESFSVLAGKQPAAAAVPATTRGLLLTFRARKGRAARLEQSLRDARALVDDEPGTIAWFALRFDSGSYGIFDLFADNGDRFAHLTGPALRELTQHASTLLDGVPDMDLLDVLAAA